MPSFSVKQAATFLGITPSRFHQLKLKYPEFSDNEVDRELLVRHEAARERRQYCREMVEVCSDAAIATDTLGAIVALNDSAKRLLYMSEEALLGTDVKTLFAPGSAVPQEQSFVAVTLRREKWDVGEKEVIRLTRRRDLPSGPVPPCRAREVDEAIAALRQQLEGDWHPVVIMERYPLLGEESPEVRARLIRVGDAPQGILLYQFLTRRLTGFVAERMHRIEFLPHLEDMQRGCRDLVADVAKQVATRFMAEGCTVYLFPRPLRHIPVPEVDEPEPRDLPSPRTLLPIGSHGFPDYISKDELYRGSSEQNAGLVWKVLSEGTTLVVDDFEAQRERLKHDQVRQPNHANFRLNSRFNKLKNLVIVPIVLGSGEQTHRETFGAIRVINCFRKQVQRDSPDSLGFELVAPPPLMVEELEDLAQRLAFMYHHLLRAVHRDILTYAVRNVAEPASLVGFVQMLKSRLVQSLDFEHVSVWRPVSDTNPREFRRFPQEPEEDVHDPKFRTVAELSYHARAFHTGRTVDIAEARAFALIPGVPSGQTAEPDVDNNFVSGFEVPIILPTQRRWGTLGLYNSWGLGHGRGLYSRELRDLCESLARLIGIKAALEPKE